MNASGSTLGADREERATAFVFLGFVAALVAVTLPFHLVRLKAEPVVFVAYGTLLVTLELATMLLLAWRATTTGDRRVGILAAAYAFAVPLVFFHVVTLPGVAPPGIFAFQSPPTEWMFWHLGYPLFIGYYAVRGTRVRQPVRRSIAIGAALGLAFALVVAFGEMHLPPVINSDGSNTVFLRLLFALCVAMDIMAVTLLLARRRVLTALDLWITCALITFAAESVLWLIAPLRFEIGTYMARALSVVSCLAVFASLAADALRADRRATLAQREASLAEASPQIVLLVAGGAVTFVNKRFCETTGLSADDALGDGWMRAQCDEPTDEERALQVAIRAGRPFDGVTRFITVIGVRAFLVRTSPVPGNTDEASWLVTAVDVDDERRSLEALRGMYAREQRISAALQDVAVPSMLPTVAGVTFDAVYRPASRDGEVGGDWYDVFVLADGRVAVSIGDSTGHGLEAASAMVRVRESLRAAATSFDGDPAEVLAFVNRSLCAANDGLLATAIFGVYDPPTRHFRYACAGHPAPFLREPNGVRTLAGGGITLGVLATIAFTTEDVTLADNTSVAFYTDGLIENERDLINGEKRLAALFAATDASALGIVDAITATSAGQSDDAALLVMTALPLARTEPVWRFHSDDPETARAARPSFAEYLARRGCSEDAVGIAELVFGELVGNVVRHAPGSIDVDLTWNADALLLRVHDRGAWLGEPSTGLPDDILSEGGRGLFLVAALAGEPTFEPRAGGGNVVTVPLRGLMPAS